MKEDWDDLEFESSLRKKLEGIESTPPPDAFAKIMAQSQESPSKKTGLFSWMRLSGWLLILFSTTFLLIQDQTVRTETSHPSRQTKAKAEDQAASFIDAADILKLPPTKVEEKAPILPPAKSGSASGLESEELGKIAISESPESKKSLQALALEKKELEALPAKETRPTDGQRMLVPSSQPEQSYSSVPKTELAPQPDKEKEPHLMDSSDKIGQVPARQQTENLEKRRFREMLALERRPVIVMDLKAAMRVELSPKRREIAPYVPPRPMFLSAYFSPLYTYKRVIPNQQDQRLVTGLSTPGSQLKERSGYAFGFDWELMLSKRLGVYAGLNFEKIKTNISYSYREQDTTAFEFSNLSATTFQVSPTFREDEETISNKIANLSLSLGLSYQFLQRKKSQHSFRAGVDYNQVVLVRPKQDNTDDFFNSTGKKLISTRLSYRYAFQASNRTELYVEPQLNYFVNSIYDQPSTFQLKPYIFGLKLGLRWRLR